MADVVNLNRFRKRKRREAEAAEAERNRVIHGRTKAEKQKAIEAFLERYPSSPYSAKLRASLPN